MKRTDLLAAIAAAARHNDQATGIRLYINGRVSWASYQAAWQRGQQARANGMPCQCAACEAGRCEG